MRQIIARALSSGGVVVVGSVILLTMSHSEVQDEERAMAKKATFGAGCFWGVETAFRKVEGVTSTAVGYMGGTVKGPTYEQVCTNRTGHAEVVQIEYDPSQVSYQKLLDQFWMIHDPTTLNSQGPDVGSQYRSVIFYHDEEQKRIAEESKMRLEQSGQYKGSIVTELAPATEFYRAEEYHQRYYEKHGASSCAITSEKGRSNKSAEGIQKTDSEWKKLLSPQAYYVTRQGGTEPAFSGKYYNNKEEGIYKCIACGNDLFTSEEKFDSGTGWPSYFAPAESHSIATRPDNSLSMRRTEVLCSRCEAHLGHVFDDGPPPTSKRYCINSAALNFIPREQR